jgi:hypothetical protein
MALHAGRVTSRYAFSGSRAGTLLMMVTRQGVDARTRPRCTVQMLRVPRALQRLRSRQVGRVKMKTAIGEFKSRDHGGRVALFDRPDGPERR